MKITSPLIDNLILTETFALLSGAIENNIQRVLEMNNVDRNAFQKELNWNVAHVLQGINWFFEALVCHDSLTFIKGEWATKWLNYPILNQLIGEFLVPINLNTEEETKQRNLADSYIKALGDDPNALINSKNYEDVYKHGAILYWQYAKAFDRAYLPSFGRSLALNHYEERINIPSSFTVFNTINCLLNKVKQKNRKLETGIIVSEGYSIPILGILCKKIDRPEDLINIAIDYRKKKHVKKLRNWCKDLDNWYYDNHNRWVKELSKFKKLSGRAIESLGLKPQNTKSIKIHLFKLITIEDISLKRINFFNNSKTKMIYRWMKDLTKHPNDIESALKLFHLSSLVAPQIISKEIMSAQNGIDHVASVKM